MEVRDYSTCPSILTDRLCSRLHASMVLLSQVQEKRRLEDQGLGTLIHLLASLDIYIKYILQVVIVLICDTTQMALLSGTDHSHVHDQCLI